jgi:hypothetical protein
MYKFTALLIAVLLMGFVTTHAQNRRSIVQPDIKVSGLEVGQPSQNTNTQVFESEPISFGKVNSNTLNWTVNSINTDGSGYDLQSNASTQEVWYDLNNPGYLHAVFTWSAVDDNVWADRTCLYYGSNDNGTTWFELGGVPVNNSGVGRSGFPSIVGTSTGAAVISDHNNALPLTTTRSTIFIDNSPFEYNFTNYDPGTTPAAQGEAIWPILGINANDDIILASSINGGDSFYVNTLSGGVYTGWQIYNGSTAETYSLNVSDGGKVGLAYCGGTNDLYDVKYQESTDNGLTWTTPLKIWDAIDDGTGFYFGCYRGVNVNFYGEEPVVVFSCAWGSATQYAPGDEAEIRFWSPNINGGVAKAIADSNNVPFYQNATGVADQMFPIDRPVIGRSQMHDYLFVAFQATTGEYWPGSSAADSTAFFQGMFTYSSDGGETWTDPEVFTPPSTPSLDFRHVSIVPVAPVNPIDDDVITVHLIMQGDPMPASTANGWNIMPPSLTALFYHFTTDITVVGNKDEIITNNFDLEQNYPNPFNPSTTINYSISERSLVALKVYDVLGNEVASLVNTTQEAGKHSVKFDASKLASGLYVYTLNAGDFTSSKKMMLLK